MGHERYKKKAGLVRRGQQSYLLEGSLLLLFFPGAAVKKKKKEETLNQCFRAKSLSLWKTGPILYKIRKHPTC